jgi:hypothetical protein
MTKAHVEAKIDIVNGMLGHDEPEWNTIGAVRLYGAYGAYAVHRVSNEHGGVTDLSTLGTLRETAVFLSGMIVALRIARDENPSVRAL